MRVCKSEWLLAAENASSYRRMFGLVVLAEASSEFNETERQFAGALKSRLTAIVDLPIAPAAELRELRQAFKQLSGCVRAAIDGKGAILPVSGSEHDPCCCPCGSIGLAANTGGASAMGERRGIDISIVANAKQSKHPRTSCLQE